VSQEISAALPVELGATLNVVYFPQLGYLVTLPQYRHQHTSTGDNSAAASSSQASKYYARYLTSFELQVVHKILI
jgi:DNA mismatch repair protein MSH5